MASVTSIVALGVVVSIHTVVAAIATRLLRVRLDTRVGAFLYVVFLVPLLLLVSTLVVTGSLGIGPDLGTPGAALFVTVGVPFALGLTIDYVWMPAPDEVTLPETAE